MVGDKPSDVDAGLAAGYEGLLFTGDWAETAGKLIRWHQRLGGG
jgi:phosphoglycolate phosphatase-like HAD superfamily hydrolase